MRSITFFLVLAMFGLLQSCINTNGHLPADAPTEEPPKEISEFFKSQENGVLKMKAIDPGKAYKYEASEKDAMYAKDETFRFLDVEILLLDKMPKGTIMTDLTFSDAKGNKILIKNVDLLRLVPKIYSEGMMQYPEYLMAEYERFGVNFRKEHDEYKVITAGDLEKQTVDKSHRFGIWNNCLDPCKWEIVLNTEDFSDFDQRKQSDFYLNQNRTLAHSWFMLNRELYELLLNYKNPGFDVPIDLDYDDLSDLAKEVVIEFDELRTRKAKDYVQLVELGHKSKRELKELDREQYYKWQYNIFINRNEFKTYDDILKKKVKLAQFKDEGFYNVEDPKEFDFAWMENLDTVEMHTLENSISNCYKEIVLSGKNSPYKVNLINFDMAQLSEQALFGLPFGFNPYPKTRRYNAHQDTIHYEVDRMPEEIRPYLLLTTKDGNFINNQRIGIEKIFLGWDSIEKDILKIYLVSYERIMPVWMAKIKLSDDIVDQIRVRRNLYNY